MAWQLTSYAITLLVSALISLLVFLLAWQRRSAPGGLPLALFLLGATVWSVAASLEAAAIGIQAKLIWSKLGYLGIVSTPMFLLLFALEFARQERWLRRENLVRLWSIPLITLLLVLTNEWHNLIWTRFTLDTERNVIVYGHGLWFWIFVGYVYLVLASATLLLLRSVLRFHHVYRRQAIALLLAAPFPWLGNIAYVFQWGPFPGQDLTPVGFAISGLFLTWTIYRLHLLNLMPVARERVIEWMNDALIVLDNYGRVVDLNPSARILLEQVQETQRHNTLSAYIGAPLGELLRGWPELERQISQRNEGQVEISVGLGERRRVFDLRISPLNTSQQMGGKMAVLHDITRLIQAQEEAIRATRIAEALQVTGMALSATLDFTQVLNLVLDQVGRVLSFDYGSFEMIEGDYLAVTGVHGFAQAAEMTGARFFVPEGDPLRQAMLQRRPVRVEQSPSFFGQVAPDIRSYLAVPVIFHQQVIGIFSLYSRKETAYTSEDERVAASFANQVAIALENSRMYEQVREMAITDQLTGLYSRGHFYKLASAAVERAANSKEPLSVLMIDLDHFKKINDRYGHLLGDQVLRSVALICRETLRKVDMVGRYGGEEFVILLPATPLERATAVAERLRQQIAVLEVPGPLGVIRVTASFGVAALDNDNPNSLETLLNSADQALYRAKQAGRNRVCESKPEDKEPS